MSHVLATYAWIATVSFSPYLDNTLNRRETLFNLFIKRVHSFFKLLMLRVIWFMLCWTFYHHLIITKTQNKKQKSNAGCREVTSRVMLLSKEEGDLSFWWIWIMSIALSIFCCDIYFTSLLSFAFVMSRLACRGERGAGPEASNEHKHSLLSWKPHVLHFSPRFL